LTLHSCIAEFMLPWSRQAWLVGMVTVSQMFIGITYTGT